MNDNSIFIESILYQYVDLLNIRYIEMSKEKRLKNLNTIAKKIAHFRENSEYIKIKEQISNFAKENNCNENDVRINDDDTNFEDIVW